MSQFKEEIEKFSNNKILMGFLPDSSNVEYVGYFYEEGSEVGNLYIKFKSSYDKIYMYPNISKEKFTMLYVIQKSKKMKDLFRNLHVSNLFAKKTNQIDAKDYHNNGILEYENDIKIINMIKLVFFNSSLSYSKDTGINEYLKPFLEYLKSNQNNLYDSFLMKLRSIFLEIGSELSEWANILSENSFGSITNTLIIKSSSYIIKEFGAITSDQEFYKIYCNYIRLTQDKETNNFETGGNNNDIE